jgi:hypothetical protein
MRGVDRRHQIESLCVGFTPCASGPLPQRGASPRPQIQGEETYFFRPATRRAKLLRSNRAQPDQTHPSRVHQGGFENAFT